MFQVFHFTHGCGNIQVVLHPDSGGNGTVHQLFQASNPDSRKHFTGLVLIGTYMTALKFCRLRFEKAHNLNSFKGRKGRREWDMMFGLRGLKFKVRGSKFEVQDSGFKPLNDYAQTQPPNLELGTSNFELRTSNLE